MKKLLSKMQRKMEDLFHFRPNTEIISKKESPGADLSLEETLPQTALSKQY